MTSCCILGQVRVIGAAEDRLVRVEGGTRCRARAEPGLPRARLRRPRTCRGRRACWTWRSAGAGPVRHPRATRDRAGSPSAPGDPKHLLEVLERLGQVLPDRGRVTGPLGWGNRPASHAIRAGHIRAGQRAVTRRGAAKSAPARPAGLSCARRLSTSSTQSPHFTARAAIRPSTLRGSHDVVRADGRFVTPVGKISSDPADPRGPLNREYRPRQQRRLRGHVAGGNVPAEPELLDSLLGGAHVRDSPAGRDG